MRHTAGSIIATAHSVQMMGDIVLFHDAKEFSGGLAENCMERFEEKNLLLETVNGLCALREIPLGDGTIMHNTPLPMQYNDYQTRNL